MTIRSAKNEVLFWFPIFSSFDCQTATAVTERDEMFYLSFEQIIDLHDSILLTEQREDLKKTWFVPSWPPSKEAHLTNYFIQLVVMDN
jgi:hypothetical protein